MKTGSRTEEITDNPFSFDDCPRGDFTLDSDEYSATDSFYFGNRGSSVAGLGRLSRMVTNNKNR